MLCGRTVEFVFAILCIDRNFKFHALSNVVGLVPVKLTYH